MASDNAAFVLKLRDHYVASVEPLAWIDDVELAEHFDTVVAAEDALRAVKEARGTLGARSGSPSVHPVWRPPSR